MSLVHAPTRAAVRHPRPLAAAPPPRTDAYVLACAFLAIVSVTVVDVYNILDRGFAALRPDAQPGGPIRYVVLLVPIAVVAWTRLHRPSFLIRRPTTSETLLFATFTIGLLGSIVGASLLGTEDTARPVFLPMALGLLAIFAVQEPTDREIGKIHRWISNIGLVYVVMNALVNVGILPFAEYQQYRNASVSFLALGLAAAITARQRRRVAIEIALAAVIFVTYPSATMVLVMLATAVTLYVTTGRATTLRSTVLAASVVVFAALAIANLGSVIDLTTGYFDFVNKANANATRLELWSVGVERFEDSPWIGSLFTGDAVVERLRDGKSLPFHNDFVLFLSLGGLLGIGLFLGWIVMTEITMIQRIFRFRESGDAGRSALLRTLLVGMNSFFVAMGFNPVLSGASRSAALFGLYAIAMSIGAPVVTSIARRPDDDDGS